MARLAERHPGTVPADPDQLADYFRFRDFAHFIEIYLSVVDLIKTGEDVRLLTYEVAAEMAAQNVRYAELTVTPYTSIVRGIPAEAFVEAIEDARVTAERDLGIVLRWIFDIPGELGLEGADGTLRVALDHGPSSLVGSGWVDPRSAYRDRSSSRTSTRPGPRGCTASRTPARRPARRPSGTPSASSAPSGSVTARPRSRIPSCSPT